ncbi:acetoacetate decarboxylase family protein [uncultured Salinisphaera sp.]|uniref:acetoacetate decarboxylase family protein n=1 Tax=uncultured Salinisphaera sp. TaxID=359372 RepID=UPI0032B1EE3D
MSDHTPHAPPPWRLTGSGYVLLLFCSQACGNRCAEAIPGLAGQARGGIGALMLVDYAHSNVGPYRELLLAPGRFDVGQRRAAVVTHIWVSTQASVDNGRRNWGLPKQLASFETIEHGSDGERVRVQLPDHAPVTLSFSQRGPRLPLSTRILPEAWRALEQPWNGHYYRTVIGAKTRARLARLHTINTPAGCGFPDIGGQKARVGVYADRFDLRFPPATTRPIASTQRPE